jgi:hypothetical protein
MTTVVYHNGVLAADSRTTFINKRSLAGHVCIKCDSLVKERANDKTMKIQLVDYLNREFDGERILALGVSGDAAASGIYSEAFKNTVDFAAAFKDHCQFLPANAGKPSCRLMLVGVRHVFVINFGESDKSGLAVSKYGRDELVCIGSGTPAARAVISVYGNDIFTAMSVANAADDYTGGEVNHIDFNQNKLTIETSPFKDITSLTGSFAKRRARTKT